MDLSRPKKIDVLIPTYRRPEAPAVTLTSLCYQTETDFDIIIADQSSDNQLSGDRSIQTVLRLLGMKGHRVALLKNIPRRGMAHQRHFLLEHAAAPYNLFLDDDLILEDFVIQTMKQVMEEQRCGFVGSAVIGLSYKNDYRPHEQHLELWERVRPENVRPFTREWERYKLHNAANVLHVQERLHATPQNPLVYKVAWVGGRALYDRNKLLDVGGFGFWKKLPEEHAGEDVLAQLRVMKKYGGCAVLPSGVYHQELQTTVTNRTINAPEVIAI